MISVIIATYNAQLYLQKTFDSLKLQRNRNFELIVVDGNSIDETLNIIKSNFDIVTKYISEPDSGLYDAWNKGIKLAHGEWICFLGAGDTLVPEAIERYEKLLFQLPETYDFVSAKINRVDLNGNFLSNMGKAWNWNEFKSLMIVAHVGSLHSRKLFDEVGFFDTSYQICADYELLLRKKSGLKCFFLDYIIADMPIGGTSFSVSALKESAKAKYRTAKQPAIRVFLSYLMQLFLYRTYIIRHKQIAN